MSVTMKNVGLDVHKITIEVAVAEDGKGAEVRGHGEIANTPAALAKLLSKLGGPGVDLHNCHWRAGNVVLTKLAFCQFNIGHDRRPTAGSEV